VYRSVLTEVEGEDVLVITHSDNGLEYKDSRSCYHRILCSEVGVLPQNTVILLVTAYNVWQFDGFAFGIVVPRIKIFDST
jgi:hypothetical protein